jgi:DNA replication protein DnaC
MAYSREILESARIILENRRIAAEAAAQARHSEVLKKCPEIGILDNEIASAGLNIIKSLGMKSEDAKKYIDELAKKNIAAQAKKAALLKENGFPDDYLETPYTCKKCNDTGYLGGRFCECHLKILEKLSCEELSKSSRLTLSDFDSFSLDYYNGDDKEYMKDVFEYCRDYADDFSLDSPNLYFHGGVGLGKTHLSLAIANEVIKKGFNVVYGSAQNLVSKIERERFGRSQEPEGTTEEKLLGCDLLILDDLGVEFSTAFTVSAIYNIINTRLCESRPTIISSNLDFEEIEKKYEQRLTSRIMGSFREIEFVGDDIRQLKASE